MRETQNLDWNQHQNINPIFDSAALAHELAPEVALFLIAQNPVKLYFTNNKLNAQRLYQEITLLENVLRDENANSLVVCLAIQNTRHFIETFFKSNTKDEINHIAWLIKKIKKVTHRAVIKRNRKFFSSDRIELKAFDKFLDRLIEENRIESSVIKDFFHTFIGQRDLGLGSGRIKASADSTEIQDFRYLKTYSELETKIEEFFISTLGLNIHFKKVLYDLEFRHCIQLVIQSTSTTKDRSLLRETKLMKLLLEPNRLKPW